MYVVMNQLHVPPEGRENVAERFRQSAEKMKEIPGCLDFMFLHPTEEENEQIVLTKWETKRDYENWVNSSAFKEAHKKRREDLDKSPTQGNTIFEYEALHHI